MCVCRQLHIYKHIMVLLVLTVLPDNLRNTISLFVLPWQDVICKINLVARKANKLNVEAKPQIYQTDF